MFEKECLSGRIRSSQKRLIGKGELTKNPLAGNIKVLLWFGEKPAVELAAAMEPGVGRSIEARPARTSL